MSAPCPYQIAVKQKKRINWQVLIEPVILFISIFCITALLGAMQMRDEQALQAGIANLWVGY